MTSITVNLPNSDVGFFKAFLQRMGWSFSDQSEKEDAAEPCAIPPRTFAEEMERIDAVYAKGQKTHSMEESFQLFEKRISSYGD